MENEQGQAKELHLLETKDNLVEEELKGDTEQVLVKLQAAEAQVAEEAVKAVKEVEAAEAEVETEAVLVVLAEVAEAASLKVLLFKWLMELLKKLQLFKLVKKLEAVLYRLKWNLCHRTYTSIKEY